MTIWFVRLVNNVGFLVVREESWNTYTTVLFHIGGTRSVLLALLDRNRPVHAAATVDLQILLVGVHVHLNPRRVAGQLQHGDIRRFRGRVARSIEDKGVVVTGAVKTAFAGREDVGADLLGSGKVQGGAVDNANGTSWDEDVVDIDVASGVGHV